MYNLRWFPRILRYTLNQLHYKGGFMPNSFTWLLEESSLPYYGTVKRRDGTIVYNEFNSSIRDDIYVSVYIKDGQHYVSDDNELAVALLAFAAAPPTRASQMTKGVRKGQGSRDRLYDLGFDPLGALVDKYHQLEAESDRQAGIRDKTVEVLKADGKPQAYYLDGHLNVISKQIDIANALLKYGYSPVTPANVPLEKPKLVIELDSEEYFEVVAQE
jgi:hypothetical protein